MHKDILLVEDNPDDVELTRLAFDEAKIANRLVVVGDGAEALDYLFARGRHEGRDPGDLPSIVLLDLNLPKVDGREVLQAIRANEATRTRPVVVYCATGGRSAMAAAVLQMMGFQEVYSLAGGFSEWEKSDKPVVREARYV